VVAVLNRVSTTHVYWKLALIVVMAAVYARMYLLLYPSVAYGGAPFAAITAISAGWWFGTRGGIIVSILLGFENMLLLRYNLDLNWHTVLEHGNFAGLISLIIIGAAVGHMGNLSRKVKGYTELLQYEAFHDPLTRLPNRALFYDRLEHAMARVSRGTNSVALLFLDLDGFKQVNDRYGHLTSDRLLTAFAGRLSGMLRAGDTLARLGGDEFVILLEDLPDLKSAEVAAERLEVNLRRPFTIGNVEIAISASIGIAFRSPHSHRPGDLLNEADRAMYQAKTSGKARYQVFQPEHTHPTPSAISPVVAMAD
jgi:diguanylate cyclase (GGDEF)-like protein